MSGAIAPKAERRPTSTMADHAAAYARDGIAVFPLQPREKKPYGFTTGLHMATTDPQTTLSWWCGQQPLPLKPPAAGQPAHAPVFARPASNIGIATGVTCGFWVLDIDGEAGAASLAALEAEHGALPFTVEQSTGKGRHICFAWDPAVEIRNSAGKIGPGVDVRGNGGYIVAPPSIHPSGREYAWAWRRSPFETRLAKAPDWLVQLARPVATPVASAATYKPRIREGRASPYGEAALDSACREISQSPPGRQNSTLFWRAYSIGRLCAGGEIETGYARSALEAAGSNMAASGRPWTLALISDTVERGMLRGDSNPRSKPDQATAPRPTTTARPAATTPAELAIGALEARELWEGARSAWCTPARQWLEARGLDPSGTDALSRMRAHARAPWGDGQSGPGLLAPLRLNSGDPVDALAVLPLHPLCDRFSVFIGDPAGRAFALTDLSGGAPLIVGIDLADVWALAQAAPAKGFKPRAVVTPTLRAFAGGTLGDRYGRVDPDCPMADPDAPPWRLAGVKTVYLAVRRDLEPPEIAARKAIGGTRRFALSGDGAARFYGSLAEQHWRRAGADAVRLLAPRVGNGFNNGRLD